MVNVLVFGGWFGSGNLGDDAILIGIREIMHQCIPEAEITALSSNPEYTKRVCGVDAVPLRSPRSLIPWNGADAGRSLVQIFENADICLVSGGTPIYDYGHLARSLHFGLPTMLRRNLVCFGIGAKPITSTMGRHLIRLLMGRARLISTRDAHSRDLLKSIGVDGSIRITGDSALFMEPSNPEIGLRILRERGMDASKPMVAVCPRALSTNYRAHYHEELTDDAISRIRLSIARAADRLAEEGYEIVFIPMHTAPFDNDLAEIEGVIKLMHNREPKVIVGELPPRDVAAILGRAELVVGLRLHSLILAAAHGVPAVSVNYDSKIMGFMELAGVEEYLCETEDEPSSLIEKAEKALDERGALGAKLFGACEAMRSRIRDEARRMATFVEE
jgi:polysaccharide pyruvyl transferase WcaK-like protein